MKPAYYISELTNNKAVFRAILNGLSTDQVLFKAKSTDWCILEIICHLYDEEREDFRTRVRSILDDPLKPLPPADPVNWAKDRGYMNENFELKVQAFLSEREHSINWLESLQHPKWDNAFAHPKMGPVSALLILTNWVVHDHLHIKQITRRKYEFLERNSKDPIDYAGQWK